MIPNFKAHPWHGVSAGDDAPNVVTTFIEIVPADTIKYEVDKKKWIFKSRQTTEIFEYYSSIVRFYS